MAKLTDLVQQFFSDKSLDFINITPGQRKAIEDLAPEVRELVDGIDPTKITHDVVKSRKRNWIRRIWDLTSEPVHEVVTEPVKTPQDRYASIVRALIYPQETRHLEGSRVRAERLGEKIRKVADDTSVGVARPVDVVQRCIVFATVGLAQLPPAYHKAYLDALMAQKVGDTYVRRSDDKEAWFKSAVVSMWEDAGCKTVEDIAKFEAKHKNPGALHAAVASHGRQMTPEEAAKLWEETKSERQHLSAGSRFAEERVARSAKQRTEESRERMKRHNAIQREIDARA